MDKPDALSATFSDWRTVKGRKQLQLIFEVPLEQQAEVLQILGAPMPDNPIWVGIALLNSAAPSAESGRDSAPPAASTPEAEAQGRDRPRRPFHTLPRSQQAGMLCADEKFQRWLGTKVGQRLPSSEQAAAAVRFLCVVQSRAELDDTRNGAAQNWDGLVSDYRQETGMEAEVR